jgi:hypothetical protein
MLINKHLVPSCQYYKQECKYCQFFAIYHALACLSCVFVCTFPSQQAENMTSVLKPLQLLRTVRRDTILTNSDPRDYTPGLYRTIGNVTYLILQRRKKPHLSKFVLDKCIPAKVAERLANLGPVNTLFTLEVHANSAFIPYFTDAASLDEILEVRASWPFDPEHSKILAADVSFLLQHNFKH